MPESSTIDFDALLQPIDDDNPAGDDIRESAAMDRFHELRSTRAHARELERRRDFREKGVEPPAPYWKQVGELAIELLSNESKDLELATYLIEALLREKGFHGLRDGFRLVRLLAEEYWEELHPQPDESGIKARLAQFYGLNGRGTGGTLVQPILLTAITDSPDGGPFCTSDFMQAQELSKMSDQQRNAHLRKGATSLGDIRKAAGTTPEDFYRELRPALRECCDEFEAVSSLLQELSGPDAPHTSNIRDALENCKQCLNALVGVETQAVENESEDSMDDETDDVQEEDGDTSLLQKIRTREQALRALSSVADYYRRSEPHSPLSYACDELIRWGSMSLLELTAELIPDQNSREYFKMRIGARNQQ